MRGKRQSGKDERVHVRLYQFHLCTLLRVGVDPRDLRTLSFCRSLQVVIAWAP